MASRIETATCPREHWIEPWERNAITDYFDAHPLDGYRRLSFMMLDEDVVAMTSASTARPEYIRSVDKLEGRETIIWNERDRKL